MTILVFGQSGQVATELRRLGPVTTLDRNAADLSDPVACASVITEMRPSVIINAAAYTAVDGAETDEQLATVVNGDAPGEMASAAASLDVPFLHISTDYVFDGKLGPAWEPSDKPNPIGAYGRSKLAGEQAIMNSGCQFMIMRTSWVFSAHGSNFVKTMLRLGKTRDRLTVVNDQFGGPTPAGSIADALLRAAAQMKLKKDSGGLYHFSGAPQTDWATFARAIFQAANLSVDVAGIPASEYPTPASRPANSVMDCSHIARDFAIQQPDWQAGLAEVLLEIGNDDQTDAE